MARWAPERADVLAELGAEILAAFPRGRVLVAVDGFDDHVTGAFANDLAAAFRAAGVAAAALEFGRVAGAADGDFETVYDVAAFRARVLAPFRAGAAVTATASEPGAAGQAAAVPGVEQLPEQPVAPVPAADGAGADEPAQPSAVLDSSERGVLVVSGHYLLRPDLVGIWHTTIWVDTPLEASLPAGEAGERAFREGKRYLQHVDPKRRTASNIDATDPTHPRRTFADSC